MIGDVVVALDMVPGEPDFGSEGVGIVVEAGSAVSHFTETWRMRVGWSRARFKSAC